MMRASPFEQYSSYFENIANRHKKIKSFYEIDEDEIISGLRSKVQYPCLFLEFPEPTAFDNSTNTDVKQPSGLAVLSPCKPGDFKKRREILVENEKIILDIVSQMRKDRIEGNNLWFDLNQTRWSKVGPMFTDNLYGWRLDFNIQRWLDIEYYESDWNEEENEETP